MGDNDELRQPGNHQRHDRGQAQEGQPGRGDRHLARRPHRLATVSKKQIRKVFPDHWSFMLGEIALWSFVVLLLTGVFLTFWFKPSMAEVVYDGSYDQLRGLQCRRPTPRRWTSPSTSAAAC